MPDAPVVPIERAEVSTRKADEAADLIQRLYVGNTSRFRPGGDPEISFSTAGAGSLGADRVRNTFYFGSRLSPMEDLLLLVFLRGRFGIDDGTRDISFGPGDAALFREGVPHRIEAEKLDVAVLRLPWNRVVQTAEQVAAPGAGALRFVGTSPVSVPLGRYWNSVTRLVHSNLRDGNPAALSPLVHEQLLQTATAGVLAVFPNTTMTTGYAPGPGYIAPAALRRATAFIEDNAARPITLTDIATAAGVSARALQYAFRSHHDTTPMGYLSRVRLARAHRDLQAGDPILGDTVAAIAARWGFVKPGHFSAVYRTAYGQSPSTTLRS